MNDRMTNTKFGEENNRDYVASKFDSVTCYITKHGEKIPSSLHKGFIVDVWMTVKPINDNRINKVTDVILYKGTNFKKSISGIGTKIYRRYPMDYPQFSTENLKKMTEEQGGDGVYYDINTYKDYFNGDIIIKSCRLVIFEKAIFENR